MKKIKKLTLNKEVVSILGGNDMSLVKGGEYSFDANTGCVCPNIDSLGGCVGGGGAINPSVGAYPSCVNSCAVCASASACGTKC